MCISRFAPYLRTSWRTVSTNDGSIIAHVDGDGNIHGDVNVIGNLNVEVCIEVCVSEWAFVCA